MLQDKIMNEALIAVESHLQWTRDWSDLASVRTKNLSSLSTGSRWRRDCGCGDGKAETCGPFPILRPYVVLAERFAPDGGEIAILLPWHYLAWCVRDCYFPRIEIFEIPHQQNDFCVGGHEEEILASLGPLDVAVRCLSDFVLHRGVETDEDLRWEPGLFLRESILRDARSSTVLECFDRRKHVGFAHLTILTESGAGPEVDQLSAFLAISSLTLQKPLGEFHQERILVGEDRSEVRKWRSMRASTFSLNRREVSFFAR